jgi:hypothetical protein
MIWRDFLKLLLEKDVEEGGKSEVLITCQYKLRKL